MRKKETTDIIFGKVLRDLRNASKKTQEELALDADLERTFISMLELGQRKPTIKTLIQLARGLKMPLSEIIKQFEVVYKEQTGEDLIAL
jgi:transcriptional regulator with XRE-family HTH domain